MTSIPISSSTRLTRAGLTEICSGPRQPLATTPPSPIILISRCQDVKMTGWWLGVEIRVYCTFLPSHCPDGQGYGQFASVAIVRPRQYGEKRMKLEGCEDMGMRQGLLSLLDEGITAGARVVERCCFVRGAPRPWKKRTHWRHEDFGRCVLWVVERLVPRAPGSALSYRLGFGRLVSGREKADNKHIIPGCSS